MYLVVLKQLFIMLAIAVAGFAVTRAFAFGRTEQQFMSKLLLYVVNPCLILRTFDKPFSAELLHGFLLVMAISLAAHAALTAIALLFCRSASAEGRQLDCLDRLAVVFTNCGFIGIPLITGVFGEEGTFYLMGYLAVFNIYLWTFGYYMTAGTMRPLKVITNPNVIAVVAGTALFCIPQRLPELVASPLEHIGNMNTAVSMLLLGMLFASFKKPETTLKEYVLRVAKVSLLRLVLSAAAVALIGWAAVRICSGTPDIRLMSYVVLIAAICPTGMSVSSFAVIFGKDESYASMLVAVTSALCILTLPASIALAERLF